ARPYERSLWALRSYLDSWAGIGRVAVGMHRQGYDLQLTNRARRTRIGAPLETLQWRRSASSAADLRITNTRERHTDDRAPRPCSCRRGLWPNRSTANLHIRRQ